MKPSRLQNEGNAYVATPCVFLMISNAQQDSCIVISKRAWIFFRQDILELHKRQKREQELDDYILENFRFSSDEPKKKGVSYYRLLLISFMPEQTELWLAASADCR